MTKWRQELGSKAETVAADYLLERGYQIVARNYRTKIGEIDLIATKDEFLVIIEVRSKSSFKFGTPQESLTRAKIEKIKRVANQFWQTIAPHRHSLRFDLIAVSFNREGSLENLDHYENAF